MTALEKLKNRLIDRIMLSNNEDLLDALEKILNSTQAQETRELTSEQIEMLRLSQNDINNNRLISEADLQEQDEEWMR